MKRNSRRRLATATPLSACALGVDTEGSSLKVQSKRLGPDSSSRLILPGDCHLGPGLIIGRDDHLVRAIGREDHLIGCLAHLYHPPSCSPRRDARLRFSPERTALLVIDPVNDFLSEGGAAWDLAKNTIKLHDVVGHLKAAIEGARERGIPVLFGPMAFTEEDYAVRELQRRSGINRLMFERRMFLAGSWGPTSTRTCGRARTRRCSSPIRGSTSSRPTCRTTSGAWEPRTW